MASVLLGMVQQAPVLGLVLILSHNHTGSNFFEPSVSQTNWQEILELLFTKKGHPWIFFLRALGTRVSTQVHVAYYFVSFDGGPWILRWAPDSKLTLPFSLWKSLLQNSSACDCFMILLLLSISFVT